MEETNLPEEPKAENYSVYEAVERAKPVRLEGSYHRVAEVLAHCDNLDRPRVIRAGDKYFSVDGFMATHLSAG